MTLSHDRIIHKINTNESISHLGRDGVSNIYNYILRMHLFVFLTLAQQVDKAQTCQESQAFPNGDKLVYGHVL